MNRALYFEISGKLIKLQDSYGTIDFQGKLNEFNIFLGPNNSIKRQFLNENPTLKNTYENLKDSEDTLFPRPFTIPPLEGTRGGEYDRLKDYAEIYNNIRDVLIETTSYNTYKNDDKNNILQTIKTNINNIFPIANPVLGLRSKRDVTQQAPPKRTKYGGDKRSRENPENPELENSSNNRNTSRPRTDTTLDTSVDTSGIIIDIALNLLSNCMYLK
jgi:hypothetical protein